LYSDEVGLTGAEHAYLNRRFGGTFPSIFRVEEIAVANSKSIVVEALCNKPEGLELETP
jgi:hypothetical protein